MNATPDPAGHTPHRPVRDRARVIDDGFAGVQRWSIRIIVIAAAAAVLIYALGQTWPIWYPVALALIVASVLAPPVTWLRSRGVPSAAAAGLVMLSFLGIIVGAVLVIAPQVAGQVPDIADRATSGLNEVRRWLVTGPFDVSEDQINTAIAALQNKIQDSADAISAGVFSTISAATSAVVNTVVILILTFLFIKDGHRFTPWASSLGGRRAGQHVADVLERVWFTLGGFVRTQTLVAFIDAVIIGGALLILDVPLAMPLAVLTFAGAYIPIIGAFVSGALAVLVTLVTNSPKDALIVLIVVVLVQQLEGNVLSPWLQGRSMNLHAAVVLLAVLAGGSLFGVTGAFLAVPVTASAATVLRYVNEQIDLAVSPDAPPEDSHVAHPLPDSGPAETGPAESPSDGA